jgi:hypothetical protein
VCADGHFDVHKDSYLASAMSAFGQDAEERLEAKPASAVDDEGSETPKGHRR